MNFYLVVHIFLLWLSYLGFSLAFLSALVFLWMERRLKAKHLPQLGPFSWSLESIDRFNAKTLMTGFVLLTLGITSGVLATRQFFGQFFMGDPSEIWTFTSWFIYAGIVGIRYSATLRGRKVMLLASLAFGMIVFTFLGVNSFFGGIHSIR